MNLYLSGRLKGPNLPTPDWIILLVDLLFYSLFHLVLDISDLRNTTFSVTNVPWLLLHIWKSYRFITDVFSCIDPMWNVPHEEEPPGLQISGISTCHGQDQTWRLYSGWLTHHTVLEQ